MPTSSAMPRRPRILWANLSCLLDTSSGTATAIREMIRQLSSTMDVAVLGATLFDSERGTELIKTFPHAHRAKPGEVLVIRDEPLAHNLFVTSSPARPMMTAREEAAWHVCYVRLLLEFRPDLVFFYGGYPLDFLIADEARARAIPTAAYIANGNYKGTRWCRDVDVILTDSEATARMYEERLSLKMLPVGHFIDHGRFLSEVHARKSLLFVNPMPEKGVGIVLRLAAMLKKSRPDIPIEVVESRGRWQDALARFMPVLGSTILDLPNVTVIPHVTDMRPVYGRARMLLAPSLWWESSGRVLVEAMLNAIPAIVTNRGGMPEMVRDGGIIIDLPPRYFETPFLAVPEEAELLPFIQAITEAYDNGAQYDLLSARALRVGNEQHHIAASTRRVIDALSPLLERRAGDGDLEALESRLHRHGRMTVLKPGV